MKNNISYVIKTIAFAIITAFVVLGINGIENPKYFYNSTWPTTATYTGFYKMPKNSVDVLFFGSSHAASSICPQELYDQYGITSYNLGCEQQNILVSYYWLKEALNYQHPKAVVIDTYMLQLYNDKEPLNTAEVCTRKAIDYMRWGKVKISAIKDICKEDTNQDIWSYYLTNIRFHNRWTWIEESDFTYSQLAKHFETKGYAPLYDRNGNPDYNPFSVNAANNKYELHSLMVKYMQKIVDLCRENNIALIMIKTPTTATSVECHNAVQTFADENQVEFFDLNEKAAYRKLKYKFATDMADDSHPNVSGATKITNYIGRLLQSGYDLESKSNATWDDSEWYWNDVKTMYSLPEENDVVQYLKKINEDRYSIFMAVKDEASSGLKKEVVDAMHELGFAFELEGKWRNSYVAVKTQDEVFEKISDQEIKKDGTYRDGRMGYKITSAGAECGNSASINLAGIEYSKNQRGINIVVYDNIGQKVVDSVCFDTHVAEETACR
jgi:hypothetical protein